MPPGYLCGCVERVLPLPQPVELVDAKYLLDIDVDDVLRFEAELFDYVETKYPEIPEAIRTTKVMDEETEKLLVKAIEECKKSFK